MERRGRGRLHRDRGRIDEAWLEALGCDVDVITRGWPCQDFPGVVGGWNGPPGYGPLFES